MGGYLGTITALGKVLYPSLLWKVAEKQKAIYLTFDDGPVPEVTPRVLSLLRDFNAKATFFCIGENVEKHPELYQRILAEGHSIGNHTNNHLNGWKTPTAIYLENTLKAEAVIKQNTLPTRKKSAAELATLPGDKLKENLQPNETKMFRPPYGRIRPGQIKRLREQGYKIVMWDVVSGDFDHGISPESCYKNVVDLAGPGSIIVFHDSIKAFRNLKDTLPRVLDFYNKKGFTFKAL